MAFFSPPHDAVHRGAVEVANGNNNLRPRINLRQESRKLTQFALL